MVSFSTEKHKIEKNKINNLRGLKNVDRFNAQKIVKIKQ